MTPQQNLVVKESWLSVAALDSATIGGLFYRRLFQLCPEAKALFRHPVPEQSGKLLAMLHYIVGKLDRLNEIKGDIASLARRHVRYGAKPEQYAAVGEALLWTLECGLGVLWTPVLHEAWAACYATLSAAMLEAVGEGVGNRQ